MQDDDGSEVGLRVEIAVGLGEGGCSEGTIVIDGSHLGTCHPIALSSEPYVRLLES